MIFFNISMTQNEEEEGQSGSPDIETPTHAEEVAESMQEYEYTDSSYVLVYT